MAKQVIKVKNCSPQIDGDGCPAHHDDCCQVSNADCFIATYGKREDGGKRSESGGVPEQCPLRLREIVLVLHPGVRVNTGAE